MICVENTVLDLFCGPGGLGSGFARAGFDVQMAVDWDPNPCGSYRRNHPGTEVKCADVRTLDYARGDFDGILGVVGGPPCRSDSVLNSKRDPNDARGMLVFEMVRAAIEMRPKWLLIENTKSILKRKKESVVRLLKQEGYKVKHGIAHGWQYGSVQKRPRWICIAHRSRHVWPLPCPTERKARDILVGGEPANKMGEKVLAGVSDLPSGRWAALPGQSYKAYHVVDPDGLMPTVTNASKMKLIRPNRRECLSFEELLTAQGFPQDYDLEGTITSRQQQLADAVPVEVATAFATALANAEDLPNLERWT